MNKNGLSFRKDPNLILYVILAISVILRLPNLNESIWFDELGYATSAMLKNLSLLWNTILLDRVAPFYRVFMFFWIRLFGDAEISIRIPSLIAGIFSIYLSYRIALKFTNRKVALLTAFLLCVSPVHIWYSQEAAPYSMLLFLFLSTIFLYYKLTESGSGGIWYLIYFLSLLFTVFIHYSAFIYLFLFIGMCLFKIDEIKRKILGLNLIVLALFLLYLFIKIRFGDFQHGAFYLRSFTPFELWMLFFNWFIFGNSLWNLKPYTSRINDIFSNPVIFYSQVFFFIIFIKGLMSPLKERRRIEIILYLFALPILMLGLTISRFKQIYIERTIFMILPFFYIVLASGIDEFKNRYIGRMCIITFFIFSSIALIEYERKTDEWTVYRPNPDWRACAGYLESEIKNSGEPLQIGATSPASVLIYYGLWFKDYTQLAPNLWFESRSGTDTQAKPRLLVCYFENSNIKDAYEILSAKGPRIFYLIEDIYWSENFDNLLKVLTHDPRFSFLESRSFRSLKVFKFRII